MGRSNAGRDFLFLSFLFPSCCTSCVNRCGALCDRTYLMVLEVGMSVLDYWISWMLVLKCMDDQSAWISSGDCLKLNVC